MEMDGGWGCSDVCKDLRTGPITSDSWAVENVGSADKS